MNIVIMESLGIPAGELNALKAPFEAQGHVFREYLRTADRPTLVDEAKDADVMILANMPMPAQVIDACPKLKFVDIAFTGVDHVAMDALRARGIAASNASGYSNEAVAELGVALALGLLRNIPKVEARCREGGTKDGLVGCELRGKTVGIVGLGKIGRRAAELYHAFGCEILASSRSTHPDGGAAKGAATARGCSGAPLPPQRLHPRPNRQRGPGADETHGGAPQFGARPSRGFGGSDGGPERGSYRRSRYRRF